MIILVINCGSSSIKYQLLDMRSDDIYDLMAKGIVEKIGLESGRLVHTPVGKNKVEKDMPIPDHTVGMQLVLDALVDKEYGVLKSFEDIEAVGHRIVQGADFFSGSAIVNEDVISKIDFCCDFAPLHNPAHLLGIRACQAVLPNVPQVVTFDTAFHQTMPPQAYMYGLPYEYYEKYHIRRYGCQTSRSGHQQFQDHYLPHRQRKLDNGDPQREINRHIHGTHPSRGFDHGYPLR